MSEIMMGMMMMGSIVEGEGADSRNASSSEEQASYGKKNKKMEPFSKLFKHSLKKKLLISSISSSKTLKNKSWPGLMNKLENLSEEESRRAAWVERLRFNHFSELVLR